MNSVIELVTNDTVRSAMHFAEGLMIIHKGVVKASDEDWRLSTPEYLRKLGFDAPQQTTLYDICGLLPQICQRFREDFDAAQESERLGEVS